MESLRKPTRPEALSSREDLLPALFAHFAREQTIYKLAHSFLLLIMLLYRQHGYVLLR